MTTESPGLRQRHRRGQRRHLRLLLLRRQQRRRRRQLQHQRLQVLGMHELLRMRLLLRRQR
jgi:hypothetical protein